MTYLCNEDIKSVFTRAGRCSGISHGSRVFNSDSFLKAFRVPHLPEDSREGASILSKVKILKYDCTDEINGHYKSTVKKIENPYMSPRQKEKIANGILPKNVPLDNGRQGAGNIADMWLGMRELGEHDEHTQREMMSGYTLSVNGIREFGNNLRRFGVLKKKKI